MEKWTGTLAGVALTPNFWNGRVVLVTGHTGFKGSWLTLMLMRLGARVYGAALAPNTSPNLFDMMNFNDISNGEVDIRNSEVLKTLIGRIEPEIVFHLAAQSLVTQGYRDPVGSFDTNLMGTVNLLEAIRDSCTVKVAVIVTTDKVYLNTGKALAYSEDYELGGDEPYSASKSCAELAVNAYRESYFNSLDIRVATVRSGNVIGGGDWCKDRLVPDLIHSWCKGEVLHLRNPYAIRPWQYVLESLRGYIMLAEKLSDCSTLYPHSINFGPNDGDHWKVFQVIDYLSKILGIPKWIHEKSEEIIESHELRLDASLAHIVINWSPQIGLRQALDWTAQWYQAWRTGKNMKAASNDMLDLYLSNIV